MKFLLKWLKSSVSISNKESLQILATIKSLKMISAIYKKYTRNRKEET